MSDNWISVDDQMPVDEGEYLCHFSDGSIETYPLDWNYGEAFYFETAGEDMVTHWQPLPEPPQLRNE